MKIPIIRHTCAKAVAILCRQGKPRTNILQVRLGVGGKGVIRQATSDQANTASIKILLTKTSRTAVAVPEMVVHVIQNNDISKLDLYTA